MKRIHSRVFQLIVVLICCLVGQSVIAANPGLAPAGGTRGVPGEFERQDALLLAWDETDKTAQEAQIAIVRAIWRSIPVIVLVNSARAQQDAAGLFRQAGIPRQAVRFVRVAVDTVWVRDFGPVSIRGAAGRWALVNSKYERMERPNDDDVPLSIAPLLKTPTIDAPLRMQGGNLLSNGAGLLITTSKILDANVARGYEHEEIEGHLKAAFSIKEILVLEPLLGEPTGHVDMFATFTAHNCVIVGQYSAEDDPINAGILDRNAQQLARINTPHGPLKVIRIPMPAGDFDLWRTHTNVIFANKKLLVPFYPGYDRSSRGRAVAAFRQALPGWKIVGVDCNSVIESGGALHCLSMNLGRINVLPETTPLDGRPDPVRQLSLLENEGVVANIQTAKTVPAAERRQFDNWITGNSFSTHDSHSLSKRERSDLERRGSDVWRIDDNPRSYRSPAARRLESTHLAK